MRNLSIKPKFTLGHKVSKDQNQKTGVKLFRNINKFFLFLKIDTLNLRSSLFPVEIQMLQNFISPISTWYFFSLFYIWFSLLFSIS